MTRRNTGLRTDADFTEDTVGFAIESFLSILSFPRLRFSIEPFSRARERWLGADARLDSGIRGFRPFYMQFKRPTAYPDYSTAKVVRDRKSRNLPVAPQSIFFQLRDKQPSHFDYQHNVLFRLRHRLRARNLGDAAYVCPLFLDRSAYRFHVHDAARWLWLRPWRLHPWELEDLLIHDGTRRIAFDRIPVLAEHVSIPPHEKVSTAKHFYSFTHRGTDLCFHSPDSLPEGMATLDKFLTELMTAFLANDGKIRLEAANNTLRQLLTPREQDELIPEAQNLIAGDDPIPNWLAFGDRLRQHYEIEQFAFIAWEDGRASR